MSHCIAFLIAVMMGFGGSTHYTHHVHSTCPPHRVCISPIEQGAHPRPHQPHH